MKRPVLSCVLLVLCWPLSGLASEPAEVPDSTAAPGTATEAKAPVHTLEVIEALRPDVDWAPDPFVRRPNRFDNRFGGNPSPEEISLQHGGYLMYGITRALQKGGSWLNRATGGPAQIEHAVARDVPLDDEQIARAARWSASQE